MTTHVSAVCRAAYYQFPQLRPLIRSLSSDAAKMLVQTFISTRLDYCNSLVYGISDNLYRRLQAVHHMITPHHQHEKERAHHARHAAATHIGFQSTNACNSRLPCWCTKHCTTSCLRARRETATFSTLLDADDCVRRTLTCAKCRE